MCQISRYLQRVRFERGAKRYFPTLKGVTRTSGPKAGRSYTGTIAVAHYEPRCVEIPFLKRTPSLPKITVDGPTESPHRYGTHQLCIWYPQDPDEYRWAFEDGLLVLFRLDRHAPVP
jgi:hypothetical protein